MENMVNHTDKQLITLINQGNEAAFATLYERYRAQVFMYILSLTKDESLAEDFAQETYIKVLLNLREGSYTHNEKYLGWVKCIAHNVVFDYFRRQAVHNTTDSGDRMDEVDFSKLGNIADTSHKEAMERERILSTVENSIFALPDNQVEVVRMHYWNDMSFKEIAAQQNVSINTALGRMHYAVINLRKLLTGKIA